MCFCSMKLKAFVIPTVQFNGHNLVWVKEHKYLGVFLSDDLTDDSDIMRQMKAFYARGNTLVRKFRVCTDVVKPQLLKLLSQMCTVDFYGLHSNEHLLES